MNAKALTHEKHIWLALGLYTLAIGACRGEEEERPFEVVAAQRQTLAIQAEAAGVLEPVRTVEVKSKASGEILQVPVETGDVVEAGQLLVQVEQTDARQTLAQARADLEVAQARLKIAESQLERSDRMRETGVITEQDFEAAQLEHANAKAQLVRAQSNLQIAQERMEETTIRAPIGGTIIEKLVEAGNVISSATQVVGGGTVLMTMADLEEVQVRTLVDETDIGRVQVDLPADITVEAYRESTFRGRVLKIEPLATVQQNVTMFPVIIRIDNRDGLLKPGMSAEVTVQVARTQDAVTVPTQAIHPPENAREVAQLALGMDSGTFDRLLSENTPQTAQMGSNGEGRGAGTDGGDAEADALLARFSNMSQEERMHAFQSATPEERRRLRDAMEHMQEAREGGGRAGGPAAGVVFAMRDGALVPVPVRTGVTDWEYIEVIGGLQEGDSVALLPTASLLRDQTEMLQRFQRFRGSGVPGMRSQGS
jgi:HlyD family secretion protein